MGILEDMPIQLKQRQLLHISPKKKEEKIGDIRQ